MKDEEDIYNKNNYLYWIGNITLDQQVLSTGGDAEEGHILHLNQNQ